LYLIDLSLKNVLLMARSWWTGRKRWRPEDEGAPVVHVFQGEGRRRLKRRGTGGCISVAGIFWRSATLYYRLNYGKRNSMKRSSFTSALKYKRENRNFL